MTNRRVTIQWTDAALQGAKSIPQKVRKGLVEKIDALASGYPDHNHKPLIGPLSGCFSIKYSRYRLVYKAEERELASGEISIEVTILILAIGIRRNGDKQDVYKLAKRLVESGLLDKKGDDND